MQYIVHYRKENQSNLRKHEKHGPCLNVSYKCFITSSYYGFSYLCLSKNYYLKFFYIFFFFKVTFTLCCLTIQLHCMDYVWIYTIISCYLKKNTHTHKWLLGSFQTHKCSSIFPPPYPMQLLFYQANKWTTCNSFPINCHFIISRRAEPWPSSHWAI